MNNIAELITKRRSVRTYDGRALDESTKEQLLSYANAIKNPFNIPVKFKFLDAKKEGLTCPTVSGTDLYVGGKIENGLNVSFVQDAPKLISNADVEYIASYKLQ